MYIGNINLPAIDTFKPSGIRRSTEAIPGLGIRGHVPAEFIADIPAVSMSGYLLQLYGGSRTLHQFKEDAEALVQRGLGYNYVDGVKGRSGWISVSSVDVDDEIGQKWPVSISGSWYDASQYMVKYQVNPVTMVNDWDILGSYDQEAVESADDVQCYDGSTEIFSTHHIFSGDCTIKNGLYQIVLSENTITVYYWNGSEYIKIDDFSAGTFDTFTILKVNGDVCTVKTDNSIVVTVERGRVPHIKSPVDIECTSLSPDDQSTSTDNYLELGTDLYVCSTRAFSIASNVVDSGDLWVFYSTLDVSSVAHDAIVKSNLKRTVVLR